MNKLNHEIWDKQMKSNTAGGLNKLGMYDDRMDLSNIENSEEYLDMISHSIPISELYKIEGCCSNNQQNNFCAVLIKIVNMEL